MKGQRMGVSVIVYGSVSKILLYVARALFGSRLRFPSEAEDHRRASCFITSMHRCINNIKLLGLRLRVATFLLDRQRQKDRDHLPLVS